MGEPILQGSDRLPIIEYIHKETEWLSVKIVLM